MKKIYILTSLLFATLVSFSQTIVAERIATLQGIGPYVASGSVTFSEWDNGSFTVSLDEQFFTSNGPDVQLFLAVNDQQTSGGQMITDLSQDNHFMGARIYNAPSSVTSLDKFDHIYIVCFMYTVPWGKGALNDTRVITGINDQKETNTLEVFPNPASHSITVNIPEGFESSTINVYSSHGELLKKVNTNNHTVNTMNINDLEEGVYLITMKNDSQIYSQRLTVYN